jgi:ABC-type multidrug transport system permease subunit
MRRHLIVIGALVRRALNEIIRVPGASLPGVLAPAIFMLGLTAVFSKVTHLRGFSGTDQYLAFILPVGLLQGAGFTGAATGVNLARDIEQGWFDRLLVCPVPRPVLMTGIVASAALRALIPATFLITVGFILGVRWPGFGHLLLAAVLVSALAATAACWGSIVALRFRTQQAAPLMQIGSLIAVLFTNAYAPTALLSGWLHDVASVNPVTHVLNGVRQGFVGPTTWGTTWPALVAVAALLLGFGALAVRSLVRVGR